MKGNNMSSALLPKVAKGKGITNQHFVNKIYTTDKNNK